MGERSRLWAKIGVLGPLIGLLCGVVSLLVNSPQVFTRIDFFYVEPAQTMPKVGSKVTVYWQVSGAGSHAWLDGKPVIRTGSKDITINQDQDLTLSAAGLLGQDSKTLTLTVHPKQDYKVTNDQPTKVVATTDGRGPRKLSTQAPSFVSPAQPASTDTTVQPPIAPLPAAGDLTVDSNATSLTVRSLANGAVFGTTGPKIVNRTLPAATYTVSASREYFLSQTQQVTVQSGRHASVKLALVIDLQKIRNQLRDAGQRAAGNDPRGAVQIAGWSVPGLGEINLDEVEYQVKEEESVKDEKMGDSAAKIAHAMDMLGNTHPFALERMTRIRLWGNSDAYREILNGRYPRV